MDNKMIFNNTLSGILIISCAIFFIESRPNYDASSYGISDMPREKVVMEGRLEEPAKNNEEPKEEVDNYESVNWVSEKDWRTELRNNDKPSWIFFSQKYGCPPCEQVKSMLKDPEVVKVTRNLICVKINENRARQWKVRLFPYSVFYSSEGNRLGYGVTPSSNKESLMRHLRSVIKEK